MRNRQSSSFRLEGTDWAFIAFTVLAILRWVLLMTGNSWFFWLPLPHPMTNYPVAVTVSGLVTVVMFYIYSQSQNEIVKWVKYIAWACFIYILIFEIPGS